MTRKIILFMTVGTGIGKRKEQKIQSLAHGLLHAITHYKPDRTIFFGSEKSKDTIRHLKEMYKEEMEEPLTDYEFVILYGIDDFKECFKKVQERMEKYKGEEVIVDYTSGTKTMTVSAAVCGTLYRKQLSIITGERDHGIVIPGTEEIKEQSLHRAYGKRLFDQVVDFFNSCQFNRAKEKLSQIVSLDKKDAYTKLIEAYQEWDRFYHERAKEKLLDIDLSNVDLRGNKRFFGKWLEREGKERFQALLVDLIGNAERRITEEKYDDGVARLYRAIELVGQIKLYEIGLDELSEGRYITQKDLQRALSKKGTSPSNSLQLLQKYEASKDEKGRLKLGLYGKYDLLKDLGWKKGETIIETSEFRDLLQRRNNSILAHGLSSTREAITKDFLEKTEKLAKNVVPKYEQIKKDAEFIKLQT